MSCMRCTCFTRFTFIYLSLCLLRLRLAGGNFTQENLHKQCHYLMVATCLFPVHVCLDSIIQAFHVPYNAIFQNRNVRKKKIVSYRFHKQGWRKDCYVSEAVFLFEFSFLILQKTMIQVNINRQINLSTCSIQGKV